MNIRDIIKGLISDGEFYGTMGIVKEVTGKTCTVAPVDGSADLYEVKLNADDKTAVLPIPSIGSIVIVDFLDDSNAFVAMFSEFDSYKIDINGSVLYIDKDGLVLKKGAFSLMGIIEKLISACEKATYTNGGGTTAVANNVAEFSAIRLDLNTLFKE
jgi:hypothetical protein